MTLEPPGEPLDDEALRALLAPWLGPEGTADGAVIAVSGGPDSMALMGAAALCDRRRPILVATIDHGLRPESGAEAQSVARAASALGLVHRTLVWCGEKPRTGVQAAARAARYALLMQAAREAGASHVLTAHTLDDQAETVLMRLAHGSDLAGLAGMRRQTRRDGVILARPLLGIGKARLVATCLARGWAFVADPANTDPRFARTRLRRLLPALAEEGLTARRLAAFAARADRAERALDAQARAAWDALAPKAFSLAGKVGRPQAGPDGGRAEGHGLEARPDHVRVRDSRPRGQDGRGCRTRPSDPHPHPEVPERSAGLEGGLQGSRRVLEASFEAADAAPRDEGERGRSRIVQGAALLAIPEAVALRIVARLVAEAAPAGEGGRDGPAPRLERLESLVLRTVLPALASGHVVRRTLGRALLETTRTGEFVVGPAPPRRRAGEA